MTASEIDAVHLRARSRAAATGYDRVARTFHWVMAALIVTLVPIGMYCASLRGVAGRAAERDAWLLVHKSLGLTILVLALLRLAWRLTRRPPPLPLAVPSHERWLAASVHAGLYALLFLAPLSGLLLSQGAGQPVSFFQLFTLPQWLPIDPQVPPAQRPAVQMGVLWHKVIFKYALFGLLGLHLLGVVKHALADRDLGLWRRMWGWKT